MSAKKLVLVGLAVVFVLSSLFMVACGGSDEAAKTAMRTAIHQDQCRYRTVSPIR